MFSRTILKKLVAEVSSPILLSMIQDAASNEAVDDDLLFNMETCIAELRRRQPQPQPPVKTTKAKSEKKEEGNGNDKETSQT